MLGLLCLAQGHNAVTPVQLEPVAPPSQVKHSTTALPIEGLQVCTVCLALFLQTTSVRNLRPYTAVVFMSKTLCPLLSTGPTKEMSQHE